MFWSGEFQINKGVAMSSVRIAGAALALASLTMLSACDRSDAGAPARDHSVAAAPAAARASAPTPMLNGKPIWADNRQHSAQENVDYQFGHWGSSVGARDARDYAAKARAFIDHSPRGAEKISRPNGDVLIYDKASNTFAVARKDGAPRLFRKPPGGEADWIKAKTDAPNDTRSRRRYNAPNARDFRGRSSGDD
jgi:pyocin large subunit-like protein